MSATTHDDPAGEASLRDYLARIGAAHASLGIASGVAAVRALPLCLEARDLVVAETDAEGGEHELAPEAAIAWHRLKHAAALDGIVLEIVSGFRSFDKQVEIIRRKLGEGTPIAAILTVVAPPGFSEHHTGCAVDVNTPGCDAFEEEFEATAAFSWLQENAPRHGFHLSYPRGNASGYVYEPWHWCFKARAVAAADRGKAA
jgi:D-alanyl-D-alanine carboxypeptidase